MKFERTMCSSWVPLFVTVLTAKFTQGNCDLRCYCNLPVCVATGYMCKSDLGTCFTEHTVYTAGRQPSRHGCLELAKPQATEDICAKTGTQDQTLFCCQEDMCNYAVDVNVRIHTHKTNHTHKEHSRVPARNDGTYVYGVGSSQHDVLQQQDLWFKAAVIAVPIAGTFILVLLILLAAHMLKQDSKRQRHLLELRRQRQFNTHLLLGEAYMQKEPLAPHQEYPIVALSADCFSELYSTKDFVYDRGHTRFPNNWDPFKSSTLV